MLGFVESKVGGGGLLFSGLIMIPIPKSEIELRMPVWIAISEMFLDGWLDSQDIDRIGKILSHSKYSLGELDEILLWEVYPACRSNVFSIAGEWGYFDPIWLRSKIIKGPSLLSKLWTTTVGRISIHTSVVWRRIKRRITEERNKLV